MGIKNWESFIGEPRKISPKRHPLEPEAFERKEEEGYKHATAQDVKNKVKKSVWSSYFKFSFVRNPWDRTVSMYFKNRKESPKIVKKIWAKNRVIFNALMIIKYKVMNMHAHQQVESLESGGGSIELDFIGKFENIDEDFETVCDIIGVKSKLNATHDSTDRKEYRKYYNNVTRQIIQDKKNEDITEFGYTF